MFLKFIKYYNNISFITAAMRETNKQNVTIIAIFLDFLTVINILW